MSEEQITDKVMAEPETVTPGYTINAVVCDDVTCKKIHLFVGGMQDETVYSCQMSIETTEWLIGQLRAAIDHRLHSNPHLTS